MKYKTQSIEITVIIIIISFVTKSAVSWSGAVFFYYQVQTSALCDVTKERFLNLCDLVQCNNAINSKEIR